MSSLLFSSPPQLLNFITSLSHIIKITTIITITEPTIVTTGTVSHQFKLYHHITYVTIPADKTHVPLNWQTLAKPHTSVYSLYNHHATKSKYIGCTILKRRGGMFNANCCPLAYIGILCTPSILPSVSTPTFTRPDPSLSSLIILPSLCGNSIISALIFSLWVTFLDMLCWRFDDRVG